MEDDGSRNAPRVLLPSGFAKFKRKCITVFLSMRALCGGQEVGGFPGRTITEDYALGMELNKAGYGLRYLPAYLATGAAN